MSLFEFIERPDLSSPVLVVVLDGWIDAGLGATNALATMIGTLDSNTVVTFDADQLLDHRARRPVMHIVDGVNTGLSWPSIELRAAADQDGNDMLLLIGAEPDHSWQAFSRAVVDLALEFGARLTVGLGAYPAPVPHTRAAGIAVASASSELAGRPAWVHSTIDVPAGVQAAIERRSADLGIPAIGLWAQVPHYAATMPYPAASAALLDALCDLGSLNLDSSKLHDEARTTRVRIDELIADNAEHQNMVRLLEQQADASARSSGGLDAGGPLPSGDELAEELERFLRDQGP